MTMKPTEQKQPVREMLGKPYVVGVLGSGVPISRSVPTFFCDLVSDEIRHKIPHFASLIQVSFLS